MNGASHPHNHRSHKSLKVKEPLNSLSEKPVPMEVDMHSFSDNCNNFNTTDQPLNLSCNDNRRSVSPISGNHSAYLHSGLALKHSQSGDANGKALVKSGMALSSPPSLHAPSQSLSTALPVATLLRPSSYGSHDDDSSTCYSFHSDSAIDKPPAHSPISLTSNRKQSAKSEFDNAYKHSHEGDK